MFAPLLLFFSLINVPPADPAGVVRQFIVAETGGDRTGATALWISPEKALTPRQLRRIEKRCAQMVALTVDVTSSDDDNASVETRETVAVSGRLETAHSRFVLRRVDSGWRIASRESIEAAFVEKLKNAKNADERERLLASSPHLLNETFVRVGSELVKQLVNQRRVDEAQTHARIFDDVAQSIGDPAAISEITSARSILVRNQKPANVAYGIELGRQAVADAAVADDADAFARAVIRLARAEETLYGRFDASLLQRALQVADRLEDTSPAAHAAVLLAQQYEREWRRREAIRYVEVGSRYAEASEDMSAKIITAQMLAAAYVWNSDTELARRYFQRTYDLSIAAGYEEIAAQTLGSLSIITDEVESMAILERGLKEFRPESTRPLLWERASRHLRAGRFDAAERDLQRIVENAPADVVAQRDITMMFVSIRLGQQRYTEAAEYFAKSPPLGPDSKDDNAITEALVLRCLGRAREAINVMEARVSNRWTSDYTSIADPRAAPFVDSMDDNEELLLELQVEQGNILRALEVSESVKAELLRHALIDGGVAAAAMSASDRQQERDLESRIKELNRALVAGADDQTSAALIADLDDARNNLRDFRQRVLAEGPFRKGGAGTEQAGVEDLPASLDDLTILSYAQMRDQLIVFLIEPKVHGRRNISARFVPLSRRALQQKIERFNAFMDQRNLRADELAEELHELLVAPFERQVLQARTLCIIPHRALWRVPFHALVAKNGSRLIDGVPVFYAPSLAVLAETQTRANRSSESPTLLAFANPLVTEKTASLYRTFDRNAPLGSIPETEWEVRTIADLYRDRSRVYIGSEADEATIKREAPRYDVLHIATHGLVQENAPMFSSLLLSRENTDEEDGLLEAREIVTLDLNADTVVLSACDTGKSAGGDTRRDPVIGLSWAFLAAGCRTTVVSQWKAQSAATAKLMVEFHRQLAHGVSETEALRAAQLSLRRDPRYRHPFYWAPFIVVGAR